MKYTKVKFDPEYQKILETFSKLPCVISIHPFGSRYTNNENYNDTDILILGDNDARGFFLGSGFEAPDPIEDRYADDMRSLRKGSLNVILVSDAVSFYSRAAAAEFCRSHNIESKQDRVWIHKLVRGEENE